MLVNPLPKTQKKKHKSWLKAEPPTWIRQQVRERSNGICEYSGTTANHMHHLKEKGMGGGSGMNLAINIWHINKAYHNHDNTEFLKEGYAELKRRIDSTFTKKKYTFREIAELLQVPKNKQCELWHEVNKFLKHSNECFYVWDIKRWLNKNL